MLLRASSLSSSSSMEESFIPGGDGAACCCAWCVADEAASVGGEWWRQALSPSPRRAAARVACRHCGSAHISWKKRCSELSSLRASSLAVAERSSMASSSAWLLTTRNVRPRDDESTASVQVYG
ncbi:hypothetical protein GQ55_9G260700 [Panicum hallii var. hallii]|uniref:Uncharacterized protein n=1 Tax=Panicum hallii var. hallii TaxID=1504633 RepID=A0A2T7C738_9POAL|nr:hypothetical protein GQ55_9G260700 [Panicum hallii var. hallii]